MPQPQNLRPWLLGSYLCTLAACGAQFLEEPTDLEADTTLPPGEEELAVPGVPLTQSDTGKTYGKDSPFTIFGKNQEKRGEAFRLASETRDALLKSLRLGATSTQGTQGPKASWKSPILIHLTDSIATPTRQAKSGVAVTPDGTVGLTIHLASGLGIPRTALVEEVTRQVLTDLMVRHLEEEQVLKMETITAPDWMLYGTLELIRLRDRGRPSDLFESVFKLGKTLTVQEILNAEVTGLDAVTMEIYRVSACALLQLLLDQPEGPIRLETMMGLLPKAKEPLIALEAAFPQLRGQSNSLEKWWSLQLAASAQPGRMDWLTMEQSEQQLASALMLTVPALPVQEAKSGLFGKLGGLFNKEKKTEPTPTAPATPAVAAAAPQRISIDQYAEILARKDRAELLKPTQLALTSAGARVHPFYRRLVREYIEIIDLLADGKTRKVDERLASAKKQRALMVKEAQETEDFIDTYEATEMDHESGKFRDFLKSAEEIERRKPVTIPEISDYLDQIEREYQP